MRKQDHHEICKSAIYGIHGASATIINFSSLTDLLLCSDICYLLDRLLAYIYTYIDIYILGPLNYLGTASYRIYNTRSA